MLTDLENLRESVGTLATVYHPWVRNLSRQDRLIVYFGAGGSPNSVALVAADDAKQLVTIAKDNHNAFPAFRTRGRSLRHIQSFCAELRDIFHQGPMARLLAAVLIADDEKWFAAFDKLVLKADIPTSCVSLLPFLGWLNGYEFFIEQQIVDNLQRAGNEERYVYQ